MHSLNQVHAPFSRRAMIVSSRERPSTPHVPPATMTSPTRASLTHLLDKGHPELHEHVRVQPR